MDSAGSLGIASLYSRIDDGLAVLEGVCTECGVCTQRCDLLSAREWSLSSLCQEMRAVLNGAQTEEDLRQALGSSPLLAFLLSCEGCDRCTALCAEGLAMSSAWKPGRQLARIARYLDDLSLGIVQVDRAQNVFSTFRAAQGIDYRDLPLLHADPIDAVRNPAHSSGPAPESGPDADVPAEAPKAETLFFPGCSLVTYAPELTRLAFAWLAENVGPCLLATQCCGVTLDCLGEAERAAVWKERIVQAARSQGVKKIVTVCPGCAAVLAPVAATFAPDIEFVSFARLLVDAGVRVDATAIGAEEAPVMVVDSCNDRASMHGDAIRQLFEGVGSVLSPCRGADARCCGAGGCVNLFNSTAARERTRHMLGLGQDFGAHTLVTACPTCAYTYAFERWESAAEGDTRWDGLGSINYLEAVFDCRIDWPGVFDALTALWA